MNRTRLNFIIDVVAFAGFVVMTTTGVLMRYVLPPGSGHHTTVWGLDRHEWGGLHFWIAVIFFSILTLHLLLHWRWIVSVVTGRPRQGSALRAGLGIVGFTAVTLLSMAPLVAPVERDISHAGASSLSAHRFEGISIRGSMTLREIEQATGVPTAYLVESLKLPATTSPDERLGVLKRTHGFEILDVREAAKAYNDSK